MPVLVCAGISHKQVPIGVREMHGLSAGDPGSAGEQRGNENES